jgi:large subunit ribosomal protein L1
MARFIGKRMRANRKEAPKESLEAPAAISTLKKFKGPKFDQTVNVCVLLGLDTSSEQSVRGSVALPRGIGKTKRVIAFCPSDVAPRALQAGAVKAGGEDLVAEIEKGWMDFDVAVASPDMMRVVSRLGKVLGPKGLMPSPKAGTVTANVPEAVKEYSAGKVEYRSDKSGNVHAVIGKMSFPDQALVENLEHFVRALEKTRPSSAKGQYVRKVVVSGAMTPAVQVKYTPASAGASAE